jgi:hypothetical protein
MMGVIVLVMMGWWSKVENLRQVLQEVDWHIVCFGYVQEDGLV